MLRQVLAETDRYANDALNRLALALGNKGGRCHTLLGEGDVPHVLVDFMQRHAIDLAVIGTGSREGLEKILLGSVSEAVIREAPCPVLTVGPRVTMEAFVGFQRILCAVDFSPESLRAAEVAISIAEEYGSHLTLLHVVEQVPGKSTGWTEKCEMRLREIVPPDLALPFRPKLAVENGRPGECILHAAPDLSAEIIAMGVRGVGAIAHAASHFGSIAHQVLSLAACPVLTAATQHPKKQRYQREGL